MKTPAFRRVVTFRPIATTTATLSCRRAHDGGASYACCGPDPLRNRDGHRRQRSGHGLAGLLAVLLVFVALCRPVAAQMTGGTISGTVTDSTQAVLPGAEVTIVSQATGVSRTVLTNEKGFYSAPNLVSGRYEVRASRAGFTTAVQKNVSVGVGQEVVAKFQLQIGAVTESTEVTSQTSGVALSSSVLSNVVEGQ